MRLSDPDERHIQNTAYEEGWADAVERIALLLDRAGIHLRPDMGGETGDPAEYLTGQIEHYVGEFRDAEIDAQGLVWALEALVAVQNGPPLFKYEATWRLAMKMAADALAAYQGTTWRKRKERPDA